MTPGRITLQIVAATLIGLPATLSAQRVAWVFDASAAARISVPRWLSADSLRDALGYDRIEDIAGIRVDLNRDGVDDYLFKYSNAVCGTNCQYSVVDGALRRAIALVGGTAVYIDSVRTNGYPVIHQYGHASANSGYWTTLVFAERRYLEVTSLLFMEASLDSLMNRVRNARYGPPQR